MVAVEQLEKAIALEKKTLGQDDPSPNIDGRNVRIQGKGRCRDISLRTTTFVQGQPIKTVFGNFFREARNNLTGRASLPNKLHDKERLP